MGKVICSFTLVCPTSIAHNGTAYDNNEEKRVIDGVETNYINKVNQYEQSNASILVIPQQQVTRSNHKAGDLYNSEGVNSITPTNGYKSVKGQGGGDSQFLKDFFKDYVQIQRDNTSVGSGTGF